MATIPIQEWLQSIDLLVYEVNFLHGGYETVNQCLDLTENDLITLDITSSGHKKVLLANLEIIKRLNNFVPKPSAKLRKAKEFVEEVDEKLENSYSNVVYDDLTLRKFEETEIEDDNKVYNNVEFSQPSPVKTDMGRTFELNSTLKKPIPTPRTKSCITQHKWKFEQPQVRGDVNYSYQDYFKELNNQVIAEEGLDMKCTDVPMRESLFNRSVSLPDNSLYANDSKIIPPSRRVESSSHKKIVSDCPFDLKPSTYVNVVRPFNTSETKQIEWLHSDNDEDDDEILDEYENFKFNFKEQNTVSMPEEKHKLTKKVKNSSKTFSFDETENPKNILDDELNALLHEDDVEGNKLKDTNSLKSSKNTFDQSPPIIPSKNLFPSDLDLSYFENLSNDRKQQELNILDVTIDSLSGRESLPPPSYPPPPLIISDWNIKTSPESEGRLFPLLPPRPGLAKNCHLEDENFKLLTKKAIVKSSSVPFNYSSLSPRDHGPLPDIPSSSLSSPPQLLPRKTDIISIDEDLNVAIGGHENLYSLEEELPNHELLPTTQNLEPARVAPALPKKFDMLTKLEGYLTRNGENRWFVLDRENLNCYNNEKLKSLVDSTPVRKIAGISSTGDKCELSFEIFFKSSNNSLVLTADNLEWKFNWINRIAKLIACVCEEDLGMIRKFERAGNVHVKSSMEWNMKWLHLSGKILYMYNEDNTFQHIDLRKTQSIRTLPPLVGSKTTSEGIAPINIELHDFKLSFHGYTKLDTTVWLKCLNNAMNKLIPSNLNDHFMTLSGIPVIVDKCVSHVALTGIEVEGIYRLSGQNSKVTKLLETLIADAQNATIRPDEYQIHDVSNCLKRFFRQLNEPLFTSKMNSWWIDALSIKDMQKRLTSYKSLLNNLPQINRNTIRFIISHLVDIARESRHNKMDSINIASIFGPLLISVDKGEVSTAGYKSTNHEISIVKDFIDNHEFLFDIDDKEIEKERTMREARKRIERLNQSGLPNAEQAIQTKGMLISILISSDDNDAAEKDVITIQVGPMMSASDLEEPIREKLRGRDCSDWRLFEVVCDGELERLIDHSENILSLLLKYKDWPQELCTNNSLLYKRTDLLSNLQLCLEPKMSLWDDLKFASKKSFKRFYFEFTRCNLSYRKDPKSNVIESWRIEDLIIYLGVQKKRNPPSEFGITFYPVKTLLTGNLLGHSICFPNQLEMFKWLAVILNAQQPYGLSSDKRYNHFSLPFSSESCPNLSSKMAARLPLPPPPHVGFDNDDGEDDDDDIPTDLKPNYATCVAATPMSSSSSSSSMATSSSRPLQATRHRGQEALSPALLNATSQGSINEGQTKVSVMTKIRNKLGKKPKE